MIQCSTTWHDCEPPPPPPPAEPPIFPDFPRPLYVHSKWYVGLRRMFLDRFPEDDVVAVPQGWEVRGELIRFIPDAQRLMGLNGGTLLCPLNCGDATVINRAIIARMQVQPL